MVVAEVVFGHLDETMDDFSTPLMFPGIALESDKGLFNPFVLQDGTDVGRDFIDLFSILAGSHLGHVGHGGQGLDQGVKLGNAHPGISVVGVPTQENDGISLFLQALDQSRILQCSFLG